VVETNPLITTIIPTFRRPKLLRRAIESALNQTIKNIHITIFDNDSCDETIDVIKDIQQEHPNVFAFSHTKQMSAAVNFQFGISQVKTPFFSILADDDYLLPTFYETGLNMFSQYPDAQFFVGSTLDVDQKGRLLNANALRWPNHTLIHPPEGVFLQIEKYINWTGTLFRKEIHEKLDPKVKAIDYDFMIRISAKYPFVFSKKSCACFVHHSIGYSSSSGYKLFWPSFFEIIKNVKSVLTEKEGIKAESLLIDFFKRSLFGIGCRALRNGFYNDVREIANIPLMRNLKKFRYLKFLTDLSEKRTFVKTCFSMALSFYQLYKALSIRIKFLFSNTLFRYTQA
jgi:glycosyltransferase involved in cell wall biosynthesis